MAAARFLARKLLRFAVTVLAASAIVFVALYLLTDPVRQMLPLGTPPDQVEAFRATLGLDAPVWVQYGRFLGNALNGDFGESLWLGRSALTVVMERLPATVALSLLAMGVATVLGVLIGISGATARSRRYREAVDAASYVAVSLSEVWIALLLIYVFSVELGWTRTSGYGYGAATLALPLATLALRPLGRVIQVVRTAMAEEATQDYAIAASYKGLREARVRMVHMFKNALPPVVTFLMYDLGRLFAGAAVVVEAIFGWPGIGTLAVEALNRGDVFLTQAVVLVVAIAVAGLNFGADLVQLWIDPRLRHSTA